MVIGAGCVWAGLCDAVHVCSPEQVCSWCWFVVGLGMHFALALSQDPPHKVVEHFGISDGVHRHKYGP